MKRFVLSILACAAFVHGASAYNVTFDLEANRLRSTTPATDFPTTGLIMLVASTTNATFGATIAGGTSLSVGSFLDGTGGDDQILARFDLSITATAGVLQVSPSINTGGTFANLDGGDRLSLYWFPTLTLSNTVVPNGTTSYGTYQTGNVAPLNGSAAWTMPAGTSSGYKLYFITTDAVAPFNAAGSHTAVEATAGLFTTPIPEPGTYGIMLAGMAFLGGLSLRRKRMA